MEIFRLSELLKNATHSLTSPTHGLQRKSHGHHQSAALAHVDLHAMNPAPVDALDQRPQRQERPDSEQGQQENLYGVFQDQRAAAAHTHSVRWRPLLASAGAFTRHLAPPARRHRVDDVTPRCAAGHGQGAPPPERAAGGARREERGWVERGSRPAPRRRWCPTRHAPDAARGEELHRGDAAEVAPVRAVARRPQRGTVEGHEPLRAARVAFAGAMTM